MTMIRIVFAVLLVFGAVACGGDDSGSNPDSPVINPPDAPPADAPGPDTSMTPDADCVMNPVTYAQIINACTSATRIDKNPTLPLQNPDGTLPPLP